MYVFAPQLASDQKVLLKIYLEKEEQLQGKKWGMLA